MTAITSLERRPAVVTSISVIFVIGLLGLHYGTALHRLGLHDFLRGLFYVPVAVAAVVAGWRGGLIAASVTAVGYLPHIRQLEGAGDRALNNVLELVLMIGVSLLVGVFADASRRARSLAAARGRIAALGEVGLGMMLQVDGPLTSIEGQAESLRSLARRGVDVPLDFVAGAIQADAARMRRLMKDLRALGCREERRAGRVDLSALMIGVVSDLAVRGAGPRIVLKNASEHAIVFCDRRVLSWSMKALLCGLAVGDPPPRHIELHVAAGEREVILGIHVLFGDIEAPDLERSLSKVFGAAIGEYRFDRALCLHLLAAEGAAIRYERAGNGSQSVRLSFPGAGRNRPRANANRLVPRELALDPQDVSA